MKTAMDSIASRSISHSPATALVAMGSRLWARTRFALRRLAALYAKGRMHQAALELRRFEERHPWPVDGDDVARLRGADGAIRRPS